MNPNSPYDDALLKILREFIEARIDDPSLSIHDLCRAAFLSHPQLHRRLKNATGLSVTLFIREIRLERAKALLLRKEDKIADIASSVGFEDAAFFSRVFTKRFGLSPKLFQKKGGE